jgi:hypothetical protein
MIMASTSFIDEDRRAYLKLCVPFLPIASRL